MAKKNPYDTLGAFLPGERAAEVPDWISPRVKAAKRIRELVPKVLMDTRSEQSRSIALEVVAMILEHDLIPESAETPPKRKRALALLRLAADRAALEPERQSAAVKALEYIVLHKLSLLVR